MSVKCFHRVVLKEDAGIEHVVVSARILVQLRVTANPNNRLIKIEVYFYTDNHGQPRVGMTFYHCHIVVALLWSRWLFLHQPSCLHSSQQEARMAKRRAHTLSKHTSQNLHTVLLLTLHRPEFNHLASSSCEGRLGQNKIKI